MQPSPLTDRFGRRFYYLRLSITEACNFRCLYCLPNGYHKANDRADPLSLDEIANLASAFAGMGTRKIRLTGGEPLARHDLVEIVARLRGIRHIEKIALSTNGYRLAHSATALKQAGLDTVNISVDSLDPDRFHRFTGRDVLAEVMAGIDACLAAGIASVKLNAVLMRDTDDVDFTLFLDYIRQNPVDVRFIELMPTGINQPLFAAHHLSPRIVLEKLAWLGFVEHLRQPSDGPARLFGHPDYAGRIGIIAPYASGFCDTCNRLRVTSQGDLRLCLFAENGYPIRQYLASPEQQESLQQEIRFLLQQKEISHFLPQGLTGDNTTFSAMGG